MIQTMTTFLTLQKFKAKTIQIHHFVLNKDEGISDLSTELIIYIYIFAKSMKKSSNRKKTLMPITYTYHP